MVLMILCAEVLPVTVQFFSFSSLTANSFKNHFWKIEIAEKSWDDAGILLFDADGDNDPDLYISSGGFENEGKHRPYRDHFYINDGNGIFTEKLKPSRKILQANFVSGHQILTGMVTLISLLQEG